METVKLVNAILGALFVAVGLYTVVNLAMRGSSGFGFFVFWIIFSSWFYNQETIKHIWKKTFIFLSIESFAMPIASFVFTAGYVATQTHGAAQAIGASIGGGVATAVFGFLGFFMGVVFLLIGLLAIKTPHDVRVVKMKKKR